MRRWLARLGSALVLWGAWSVPAAHAATTPAGKIGMEMIVFLPQAGRLAVFQQVVMTGKVADPTVGLLPGATGVSAINARIAHSGAGFVVVSGTPGQFALRYDIPWNGKSANLSVPAYLATSALVFLVPQSLSVPAVLNPALVPAGHGKLPGIPHSPVFNEYATTNVAAGQALPVVLEEQAAGASTGQTPLFPSGGNHPLIGALFEALVVLVGMGALAWALNWRPVAAYSRRPGERERLLAELAAWDASYHRGEVDDEAYRSHREELVASLCRVWGDPSRAG